MTRQHITREDLVGKTIDIHAHAGIAIRTFAQTGFPYCSCVEDLYYRQVFNGVDLSVVFPYNADLFFDIPSYVETGILTPAEHPVSPVPYGLENKMLLTEVFRFCPERASHFLPFISADPGRKVKEQVVWLKQLAEEFPIYGLKIVPVACQSKVIKLLDEGEALLELAAARNWPLLFHVTTHPDEEFSQAADTFKVIEKHPELRFCLAHCIGLDRDFLERADAAPNVWVDTSALKIQVQLAYENSPVMALPPKRLDCDCSDHRAVMRTLVERFPKTIIWGSDAPAHSYITRRLQGEGHYVDFRLKGTYEEEKAALDVLSDEQRRQNNANAIRFLFGG